MESKLSSKKKGEYAELLFAAEAARNDFIVLFPNGDSAQYDFVLDTHKHLVRIQVKSSATGYYSVKLGGPNRKKCSYTNIDYFAFVDLDTKDMYLVPFKQLKSYKNASTICRVDKKFPLYKNNWQLLKSYTPK